MKSCANFRSQLNIDWFGPRFPLGSIAIVDRDLKPKDDDLVYARFRFPDHPKMNFEKLLPFGPAAERTRTGGLSELATLARSSPVLRLWLSPAKTLTMAWSRLWALPAIR